MFLPFTDVADCNKVLKSAALICKGGRAVVALVPMIPMPDPGVAGEKNQSSVPAGLLA